MRKVTQQLASPRVRYPQKHPALLEAARLALRPRCATLR